MGLFGKLKQFLFGSSLLSKNRKRKAKKRTSKSSRKRRRGAKKRKAKKIVSRKPRKRRFSPALKKPKPSSSNRPARKLKTRPAPAKLQSAQSSREVLAGEITHYFSKAKAAVVKLETTLALGDKIMIKNGSGCFKQSVKSLQINRIPIDEGRPGEEVGLEVRKEVRAGDKVYKER